MHLPQDIQEYKDKIRLWFGGLFAPGREVHIARAPARLDVMGGTFDFAGSVVLESTLEQSIIVGVQKRHDMRILLKFNGLESRGHHNIVEYHFDRFYSNGELKSFETILENIKTITDQEWFSHVAGIFPVLLNENVLDKFQNGITIGIKSNIPMDGGTSCIGALKAATLLAIKSAFNLSLDAFQIAQYSQSFENLYAPGGIMEPVGSVLGKKNKIMAMRCQPHELLKMITIPQNVQFLAIDTKFRHKDCGHLFQVCRTAVFMGREIIFTYLDKEQKPNPYKGYLCNINFEEWENEYNQLVPEQLSGKVFIDSYGEINEKGVYIDTDTDYPVKKFTELAILENEYVLQFMKYFDGSTNSHNKETLIDTGNLLLTLYDKYKTQYGLGSEETDFIVSMVKELGPENGLYGARITSDSCGGTVIIMADNMVDETIENLAAKYYDKYQIKPSIYKKTSQGALELGIITSKF